MISASDVPACPACGCREVHPVQGRDGETLYACRQCGRDQTDAWRPLNKKPEAKPVVGPQKRTIPKPIDIPVLGIGATLKIIPVVKT